MAENRDLFVFALSAEDMQAIDASAGGSARMPPREMPRPWRRQALNDRLEEQDRCHIADSSSRPGMPFDLAAVKTLAHCPIVADEFPRVRLLLDERWDRRALANKLRGRRFDARPTADEHNLRGLRILSRIEAGGDNHFGYRRQIRLDAATDNGMNVRPGVTLVAFEVVGHGSDQPAVRDVV